VPPNPPDASDRKVLDRLRTALKANGYDSANVRSLIPKDATGAYQDGWNNPALRRTEPTTTLSTLTRLFALGLDVPAPDLDDVPGADVSDWVLAGLVAVRRRTVHPLVSVQPFRMGGVELRLVCDQPNPSLGRPPFPNFVMGAVESSTQLARITLRRPFARAMDMGSGNGVHAILAARHCQSVVATDISPRALAFTRFNLAWNDVENVELRLGDRFEPVAGEEFDLVVSNPPFVVSPTMTARFRDSGLPTDNISETAVTGAAGHLAPGGWAQIMCQWVQYQGERWQDRVESWTTGTGCDAWVVQRGAQDSVSHTVEWLTEMGRADPKEADRQFEKWMEYFDNQGIVGIGTGFVVLRKVTDSDPWYLAAELGDEFADDAGEAVARIFDTQDWLRASPESGAVLDTCWRLAEHVQLDMPRASPNRHVLRQAAGLRTSAEISKDLAEIAPRCDGNRTLRSISLEFFEGRTRDPTRRTEEIEPAFRQMVAAGFVVRVPQG
jgi:methylase of polypeptide subunit release factors